MSPFSLLPHLATDCTDRVPDTLVFPTSPWVSDQGLFPLPARTIAVAPLPLRALTGLA
jgi:hypothetical protein